MGRISLKFYRLESKSRKSTAEAFSGKGGLHVAGRWNSLGNLAVYASTSVALAYLEKLAHMEMDPEEEFNLFEIEIPDDLIETIAASKLPPGWDDRPPGKASRAFGDKWLGARKGVALVLPSVIVGQEGNALINPACPKFNLDWVKGPTIFRHDKRLTPRSKKRG